MTVLYRETFKRNRPAGYDGLFDWDFLLPAFDHARTKIMPMDIDAAVERYGWKLGFETKSEGKPIPIGQMITLESLVRDGWTIVHLRGKRPDEIRGFTAWRGNSAKDYIGGAERLVEFCANWFAAASRNGHRPARFKPPPRGQIDCFAHQMTRLESIQDAFHDLSMTERAAFLAWAATLAGYNPRDDVEIAP